MNSPPIAAVALDYAAMLEIVMLCVIIAGIVLISFMMRNHVTRATLLPLVERVNSVASIVEVHTQALASQEGRLDEVVRRVEQTAGKGEMEAVTHAVKQTSQGLVGLNRRFDNLETSIKTEIGRVDAGVGRLIDYALNKKAF